jgi:hypothetical protein
MEPTYKGELMLLNASRDRVTFVVPDVEDNPFRTLVAQKGRAGHRFMAVLMEISEDETLRPGRADPYAQYQRGLVDSAWRILDLVQEKTPSQVCALLCKERAYWDYLEVAGEIECISRVKQKLKIESRSEIDHSRLVLNKWRIHLDQFKQWLREKATG